MDARTLSETLQRLAFAHELVGDPKRARLYRKVAWPVRQLPGELGAWVRSGQLARVPGIGPSVLAVAREVVAGRVPDELRALEGQIPAGLFALGEIKGLGPKRVRALWNELGVCTPGELEYACLENRLVELRGFGPRTQGRLLQALRRKKEQAGLHRRDAVARALEALGEELGELHPVGAYRRGVELLRELEVVVPGARDHRRELEGLPVRVWGARPENLGTVLLRRTGSEAHLALLGDLPQVATEEEVYHRLGLHWQPPERREAGVELWPRSGPAPRLVRREDLRGALHNHSLASDGRHSLEQLRAAAAERGLSYLGISEHSQSLQVAGGLSPRALRAQVERIAELNAEGHPCTLLSGVESDILREGELDYPPELLADLDVVIASVHQRHRQEGARLTERVLRALRQPCADVLGHPTGRLLLGRPPAEIDLEAVLEACAELGCAVELNAHPHRLDLGAEALEAARERGVLISIAADAHAVEQLDHLEHGVATARRAGLGPEQVINTWELPRLRAWIRTRRAARQREQPSGEIL